jgi:hypothetical protein
MESMGGLETFGPSVGAVGAASERDYSDRE